MNEHGEPLCENLICNTPFTRSVDETTCSSWCKLVVTTAENFHETYERLAPDYSYTTRRASAVAWPDVPVNNKRLMLATVDSVLRELVSLGYIEGTSAIAYGK